MRFISAISMTLVALSLNIDSAHAMASEKQYKIKALKSKPVSGVEQVKNKSLKKYIVQFKEKSLLAKKRELSKGKKASSSVSAKVKNYKESIHHQREEFAKEIQKISKSFAVNYHYDEVINAIAIETNVGIETIKQHENVKAVYPVQTYSAKLEELNTIINSSAAWELLGGREEAGKGIRVAVIDSGIIPDHPMFADDGMSAPSQLPSNDYCRTTDASFCNNKLIVTRHYPPSDIELNQLQEFDSPLGLSGHGTHVAGIAAGRQVTTDTGYTISGVAPGAYIMAYKALWGQDGTGSDTQLLAAIQDAVKDGADVINNSWGGSTGAHPSNSLYQGIYQELEANGIVLVTAAGNEGQNEFGEVVPNSIGCPGCIEAGITVGATSTSLTTLREVSYNNVKVFASPADSITSAVDISELAAVATGDNVEGCDAFAANTFLNKIAIIRRGTCFFEDKSANAEAAGALAVIVYNNEGDDLLTMTMGTATLPAVFIGKTDGDALVAHLADTPDETVSIRIATVNDESNQDQMVGFSSIGPNGDDTFLKPDLVAPGRSILSATSPHDSFSLDQDYTRQSGTSMATPAVAGAAALLLDHKPDLSAIAVKGILTTSSEKNVTGLGGVGKATPFQAGAGRLDVEAALNAEAYPTNGNMILQDCVLSCSTTNTLNIVGTEQSEWTAKLSFMSAELSGSVVPSVISLSEQTPNAEFTLQVNVPYTLEKGWHFGRLEWTNAEGKVVNQAIVLNTNQQESELLDLTVFGPDDNTREVTIDTINISDNEVLNYSLSTIAKAKFETESLVVSGTSNYEVTSETEQEINISATVAAGSATVSSGEAPINVNLAQDGTQPVACDASMFTNGCDEVVFSIDLSADNFNFEHFGISYDTILLSENGMIMAGDATLPSDVRLWYNTALPDTRTPNNVIAPFWVDFNLDERTHDGNNQGEMYIALVPDGDKEYLVVQWNKVRLYTDDTDYTASYWGISDVELEFSFQLIIEKGSENKWFKYIDIPEQPNFFTVGIENSAGISGTSYWHDGNGTAAPTSTSELAIAASAAGEASIFVNVVKSNTGSFTVEDQFTATEDTSVELDVLVNDVSSGALFTATVADVKVVQPMFAADESDSIDVSTLMIVNDTSHGQLEVLDTGRIRYTPEAEYSGSDSFSYKVSNSAGESSESSVTITVAAVNDAPVVAEISSEDTLVEGQSIELSIDASDIDSDLTYHWSIPADLDAGDTKSSSVTVTADKLSKSFSSKEVIVSVTISDGVVSVVKEKTIIITKKDEDEGLLGLSLNYLLLSFMAMLFLLRNGRRIKG